MRLGKMVFLLSAGPAVLLAQAPVQVAFSQPSNPVNVKRGDVISLGVTIINGSPNTQYFVTSGTPSFSVACLPSPCGPPGNQNQGIVAVFDPQFASSGLNIMNLTGTDSFGNPMAQGGLAPGKTWSSSFVDIAIAQNQVPGMYVFQATLNWSDYRTGSVMQSTQTPAIVVNVSNQTAATFGGSLPQVASGGGWTTTITLVNTGAAAAQATLNFFDNNGNPLPLPLTFPQGTANAVTSSTSTNTLNAGAELIVQTTGPSNQAIQVGWAQLLTTGSITGSSVFAQASAGSLQEGVSPLETRNPGAFVLSFDNAASYITGVALANIVAQPANIGFIIRDDNGAVLLSGTIALPQQGHTSFVLPTAYAVTAGRRGTLEFDTPANGQISVLGIRYNPVGGFSTIPALTK